MRLDELEDLHRRVMTSKVLNEDTDVYQATMLAHIPALLAVARAASNAGESCPWTDKSGEPCHDCGPCRLTAALWELGRL